MIRDLLWELHYPRFPVGCHDHSQVVDTFPIRENEGSPDYYLRDAWLEGMSDPGELEFVDPDAVGDIVRVARAAQAA